MISSVAISNDGRILAVGTGTSVPLWDLTTLRPIAELPGTPSSLAFSPTAPLLAIATRNDVGLPLINVWNVYTREPIATLTNEASIKFLAFAPNGKLLATSDDKGNVRVTEWESNHILACRTMGPTRRPQTGKIAFLPDGRRLAIGGDKGVLQLMDWQSGQVVDLPAETADGVTALAISPMGDLLAAGFGYTDGTIGYWDLRTGRPLGKLTNHTAWVEALAFTSGGERLVSGSEDWTIRVWNMADRTELRCFKAYRGRAAALAVASDGKTIISGGYDGTVCLWDYSAPLPDRGHARLVISHGLGLQARIVSAGYRTGVPDPKDIRRFGAAFLPDSRSFITSGPEGWLAARDARSLHVIERLPELGTNNWGVALSPDANWLAVGKAAGKIDVWDWKTRRAVCSPRHTIPVGRLHPIFPNQPVSPGVVHSQ
jgi:WD40 repeat protein